jgi:hypothetical protein
MAGIRRAAAEEKSSTIRLEEVHAMVNSLMEGQDPHRLRSAPLPLLVTSPAQIPNLAALMELCRKGRNGGMAAGGLQVQIVSTMEYPLDGITEMVVKDSTATAVRCLPRAESPVRDQGRRLCPETQWSCERRLGRQWSKQGSLDVEKTRSGISSCWHTLRRIHLPQASCSRSNIAA